ncbi:Beta-glucosidase; 6-phospho-beta-glucosidase [Klebsiella aerogenes]|nr:Beta-glucosidase; 6-phospho-beta-glucosidase [Klebsiella aerogenes]
MFIAHALAVKAFREMAVAGEIGFVNVLQPHTPLTDSEADIKATELADAIHTHWLYDPVLKGTYPADLLAQTQALWGVPRFAPGDDALLRDNRCDFIGLNYYRRETVSASRLRSLPAASLAWRDYSISCVIPRVHIPNGAGKSGRRG